MCINRLPPVTQSTDELINIIHEVFHNEECDRIGDLIYYIDVFVTYTSVAYLIDYRVDYVVKFTMTDNVIVHEYIYESNKLKDMVDNEQSIIFTDGDHYTMNAY